MRNVMKIVTASIFALCALVSFGDVTVMASRAYVNARTTLHPVTNNGEVVGYNVGIQTNIVLVTTNGVSVLLPDKWALANVTNNAGCAVSAADVTALPDNFTQLTNNANFKSAVEKVSPHVVLPSKWALANVTNDAGGTVTASDVGALPTGWTNTDHVAIGACSGAYGVSTVAIGSAYAEGEGAVAVGEAEADFDYSAAFGYKALARAKGALAVGYGADASYPYSTAIGSAAVSHGKNTITLGEDGTTPSQVYIGDTSIQTTIDNKVDPLAANTNVTLHVDGTDLIIRTNNVEIWHSYKSAMPTNAPVKRYALFLIHLNPNSASNQFADIELKATTNNYYGESMMFYCSSSVNGDPDKSGNPTWEHDWCRIYILTSKVDTDVRRWRRIRNTTDLGTYNPRELAIIVDPALFRRGQGSEWMSESNDELIWSYVRITASSPELDEDGVHQLWRPTMPVKWYTSLPKWANQTSY